MESQVVPVVPLGYAGRGLPQWRRPVIIPIAGIVCMLVAAAGFVRSIYFDLPGIQELHAKTLPAPSAIPPTPLPAPAGVKPLTGDAIGETGLPRASRRQLIEAVAARAKLLPDRHVMLDRLLAEVGADFTGGSEATPASLDRLRVEQLETGPDTKGLVGTQPLLGSLVIHGPAGKIEVNNCDATFARADGRRARVEFGIFTDYSGTRRWTVQEIESRLARMASLSRSTVNATQAAQAVAAVRSWTPPPAPQAFGATPIDYLYQHENGTISFGIPETEEQLWILPNGATTRVPANGNHDLDPATGMKRWSPPAQLTWIPVSRWVTGTLLWISYFDLLWIAGLFVLSATLLMNWRWSRTGLHLWIVGRLALLAVAIALSLTMVMQLQQELAARNMQPAPGTGTAFAVGRVVGAASVTLILPMGLFIVLMLPGVRRYHAAIGLRPSLPPATCRRLGEWTETNAGHRMMMVLALTALLLAALHGAIWVITWLGPASVDPWPLLIGTVGLCLTGGVAFICMRWLKMSRRTNRTAAATALVCLAFHVLAPAATAEESTENWKAILQSKDPARQEHAFKQLERTADGQVWLLQAMRDPADRVLQENVIRVAAASWSRTPDSLKEPLLGEVKKTVPAVVEVVVEDRGQISWSAVDAVRRLGHFDESAPRLCEALASSKDEKTRDRIVRLLYTLTPRRPDVTAAMVGRIEDDSREIAQTALRWLMQKPAEHLPAVVAGLDSAQPLTRQLCIGVIGSQQKHADRPTIIPKLKAILLNDPNVEVQDAAARALAQFPGDGPKALLDVIRAGPEARRMELAADNVGANPKANPTMADELATLLDDPRADVRRAGIMAFDDNSEMRKRVPVTKLFALLDDPDAAVRKRAGTVVLNEIFTFKPGYVTRAKAELTRGEVGRAPSGFASWPDLPAEPQFQPYVPPPAPDAPPAGATEHRLVTLSNVIKPWAWAASVIVIMMASTLAILRRWRHLRDDGYVMETIRG